MIYLGFGGVLLLFCCDPRPPAIPRWILLPLAYVGQFSYSIYLWHVPLQELGMDVLRASDKAVPFYVLALIWIPGCLAFGIAAAKLIELPVLHIRDRFFPSRSRSGLP